MIIIKTSICDGLIIFNSTKQEGNMSSKYSNNKEVEKNKKEFFKNLSINIEKTLLIKVKFSDEVAILDDEYINNHSDLSKEILETDAVITRNKEIYPYLLFGDCIPFVMYDTKQEILCFAHLGWQSIELNLQNKVVSIFLNQFNSNLNDLVLYLGPSIKGESYIIENPSQLKIPEWKPFLNRVEGNKYQVDLNKYIVNTLVTQGLTRDQFIISDIDTATDLNYFSHYRSTYIDKNEREGRFIFGTGMININN